MQCLNDPLQSEAWKQGYKVFTSHLIVQGLPAYNICLPRLFQEHQVVKGFGNTSKYTQSIKEILILLILRREEIGFNPFSS